LIIAAIFAAGFGARDSWRKAARWTPSSGGMSGHGRVHAAGTFDRAYARIAHLDRSIPFAILAVCLRRHTAPQPKF